MGNISLYEWLGVNYGLVTFIIVVIALGAFWFVERIEKRLQKGHGSA